MDKMAFNFHFSILFLFIHYSVCFTREEPRCSKFDFEEKVLEKMVRMEHSSGIMMDDFKEIKSKVHDNLLVMKREFDEIKRQAQEEQERYRNLIEGRRPVAKVAFHVLLKNHLSQLVTGSGLKFDTIAVNMGGAYDAGTGRFTAPINGTFQFTIVIAAEDKKTAAVNLMKDEQVVTYTWVKSDPTWAMTSNTAILDLTSGQQVWLQVGSDSYSYYGSLYSSFSGHLLFTTD